MVAEQGADPLAEYRRKRNFTRTPEPAGENGAKAGPIFVVQKHAASHLHYDLRLHLHGALKSWALPKGPSLDPQQPRMAMQTEDHPLSYAEFEGVIPEKQYGAGAVMIWDKGEWEPLDEGKKAYYKGILKFRLHGERLRGLWTLVRSGGDGRAEWLLTKQPDEFAGTDEILQLNTSVITGRTLEEIAADRDAVWSREDGLVSRVRPAGLSGAVQAELPAFIAPQLATPVDDPVTGDAWLHEIKYDGHRILCRVDRGKIEFFSRLGRAVTGSLPTIRDSIATIRADQAWLDGEIAVLRPDGTTSFEELQSVRRRETDAAVTYLLFDLMFLDGYDLRRAALEDRKRILATLVPDVHNLRFVDHVAGRGEEFYAEGCKLHLEGVISKRSDSPYISGRSQWWRKLKCGKRQELVIGGYTESGAGRPFGSLLAGYYRHDDLVFCGKIKSGYSRRTQDLLIEILRRHEQPHPPFANPPSGVEYRNPHWLRPELVAEVDFTELAPGGLLRNASFKGLRDDKNPREVVLEASSPPTILLPSRRDEPYLFPREHLTRSDLLHYYSAIAGRMLPYLADRPLTLIVCRTNVYSCKFTKHATNLPPPVHGIDVGHSENYIAVDSREGLLAVVEAGAVEIHTWGSRFADLEHPDKLVFDLDPPETGMPWERLAEAVLLVRNHLLQRGLKSFVMTTGGKGYYVVAPLNPDREWRVVTAFARRVAEELEESYPDRMTAKGAKSARSDRIYIDWMRNGRGSNAAEAYTVRARPGAPVAAPITWEELVAGTLPDRFSLQRMGELLERGDPWPDYFSIRQSLPPDRAG